ncbi:hypothetical protein BFW89_17615 [Pseudomonas synxantha]|nr:hypothetical protein BFW89_17615 [Pseudomonas synxantha]
MISVGRAIATNTTPDNSTALMWELSSPSEAAKAAAQSTLHSLNHRYRSLAKARQLPQGIGSAGVISVGRAIATNTTPDNSTALMWELSSPSEAAKAAAQLTLHSLNHRYRSLAKARQLPQGDEEE